MHNFQDTWQVSSVGKITYVSIEEVPLAGLIEQARRKDIKPVCSVSSGPVPLPVGSGTCLLKFDFEPFLMRALSISLIPASSDILTLDTERMLASGKYKIRLIVSIEPLESGNCAASFKSTQLSVQKQFRKLSLNVYLCTKTVLDCRHDIVGTRIEKSFDRMWRTHWPESPVNRSAMLIPSALEISART
ncbi:MAG: hypothetical protein KIT79_08875 [Deltaproteobacteria bacterium]|nr:hypothetical protein [Deltaproteobacteria bacterium]